MVVDPQSDNPQDVISLFPVVMSCLTQLVEHLVQAGVEVFMAPQGGAEMDARQGDGVWRWRILSQGAEASRGYATLPDALLGAIIHLVRNQDAAAGVARPGR